PSRPTWRRRSPPWCRRRCTPSSASTSTRSGWSSSAPATSVKSPRQSSGGLKTPPPAPLPEAERGERRGGIPLPGKSFFLFSPSPLRGGGQGEGVAEPKRKAREGSMSVSIMLHLFGKPAWELNKEGEEVDAAEIRALADDLHG